MNWDSWRLKESWDILWERPYINYRKHHKLFWDLILDKADGHILDMGCGPSCIWENTDKDITGVDFSESAIKQSKINIPNGKFIVSDITSIPLEDTFDTIVLCGVVNYFPNLHSLRKEVKRLSTHNTRVIITINDMRGLNNRYWDLPTVEEEFSKWGTIESAVFYEKIGWLIVVVV